MLIIAFTAEPGLEQGTVYEYGVGLIAVLAALTMIVGNTVALRQRNMKRLFAYSSIAHAGYLLIPLAALTSFSLETIWFYLLAYMLMNIGAFAVLHVLIQNHANEDMSIFSGLYHRSPVLTVMMTIFLASLAGIPGTAGFIGKFNIFLGALSADPAVTCWRGSWLQQLSYPMFIISISWCRCIPVRLKNMQTSRFQRSSG